MRFFHHEDDIGPLHLVGSKRILGIMIQPCRGAFDAGKISEYRFGGRAAPFVLATDKKNIGHAYIASMLGNANAY
jgi:hypothetical protein